MNKNPKTVPLMARMIFSESPEKLTPTQIPTATAIYTMSLVSSCSASGLFMRLKKRVLGYFQVTLRLAGIQE